MTTDANEPLAAQKCAPCAGRVEKLSPEAAAAQLAAVPGWRLTYDGLRIRRDWALKNFVAAIDFFRRVADLAEQEGHHPDLHLERYQNVWIEIWTHSIGGLSKSDFILAAKIDQLPVALKK